ncbi:Crp/Fnr family transcriptional regulator [Paraflavitalea pollutisoli]|uniref:Crp/Fnr family transcriptional regulator n=1 Tax=Paraflavitalea pollutisoli TaxID=3034143 RepID=UPI0023EBF370|nr:Crp/Fnr family transcriptional regulator [Paraflavitalea sp. H1-2-19X]
MEPGIHTLLQSVRVVCPDLTQEEVDLFAARLTSQELKKKDYFIQADKVQKAIGYIAHGLVRSFFIDQEGHEITVGFYAEGDYATHYPAFVTQQPSRYAIQCLEPTTMICLSWQNLQWIYQHVPAFERYGRLISEEILNRQQARIESFIFQTVEERYLDFIDKQPTLFNRISISQLCSFLGTERQTLTRIRQKLAHQ